MADESSRVLVVDDEPFFREAICDALRGAAIECASAESSRDALELALRPEIGAVVLDVGATGSGGLELLRRLVAERPALRVIVLSAQVDQDLVLEALRVGACDYLAKPLHDEELVLSVRRALLSSALHANWESLCARLAALEDRLAELSSAAPPDDSGSSLADRAARAVADVLGVTRASLMLLDGESQLLRVAGATGCDVEPAAMDAVEVGSGVAGAVFAEGRALAVDDVRAQQRFSTRGSDGRYRSSAFAVAPIPRDGKPIGVVCATERGDGGAFGSADLSLLRILALQVGSLLARAEGGSLASAAEISASAADVSVRDAQSSAATIAPFARDAAESGIAAEPAARRAAASGIADPAVRDAQDAELARAICDAVTSELEPERIIGASLAAVAESLPAAPVSLYLVGSQGRELVLESQCERAGHADRDRLPIAAGLTGVVFQTGRLVASDDPARDGRFDAAVDTAQDGAPRPLLCVPIRLRGKTLGVMRAFPEDGVHASARTAEILTAAVSAAVRNALLYRSLVEAVDEVASARRALRAQT